MMGFNYSDFEGITTPWLWLDRLLCRLFDHPQRSYLTGTPQGLYEICARCCKERKENNNE